MSEPDLATLDRGRRALDDRIAGHRLSSSLRKRRIARVSIGIGAGALVVGALTGAAYVTMGPSKLPYDLPTAAPYQHAFIECMAGDGWTDVAASSPEGENWVRILFPDSTDANKKAVDDIEACRASVAKQNGVSVAAVTGGEQ
ncbi:hypothetical protein [Curtobacterium sp. CFBP9011]|uniref:hypothetical protein n=1 Tax=Curtobacterium sp. CFBP9011 TaxID=3096530 RepID=UPI002A6B89CF|nr:hypothetical protein [Curtobacterium sp. CFBP9011]MDY1006317.1 hypothetical protein [Curtobacterium sp. CFBP9011]